MNMSSHWALIPARVFSSASIPAQTVLKGIPGFPRPGAAYLHSKVGPLSPVLALQIVLMCEARGQPYWDGYVGAWVYPRQARSFLEPDARD
jgi:hypothetical protein